VCTAAAYGRAKLDWKPAISQPPMLVMENWETTEMVIAKIVLRQMEIEKRND
jgi:hypothetical protein